MGILELYFCCTRLNIKLRVIFLKIESFSVIWVSASQPGRRQNSVLMLPSRMKSWFLISPVNVNLSMISIKN